MLFAGSSAMQDLLVKTLAGIPESAAPIDAVALALQAAGAGIQERRDYSHKRQAIIVANPELRERELIKLASLAAGLAGALRERGVPDPAASLAAEAGIAVFRIAFERWSSEPGQLDLPQLIRESFGVLKAVTAASDLAAAAASPRTSLAGPASARPGNSLRKDWNAVKDAAAPWWRECSKEAFSTGLDQLARALKNWGDSRTGK
ncbi:MAG TPA: hypothetical protein VGG25_27160, partial [Streptosporangiaceae bacterium]